MASNFKWQAMLSWPAVSEIFIFLILSKSWHAFKKLLKLTTTLVLVHTLLYNLQCICHAERLISDGSSASGWGGKKCHSVLWNETRFYKTHSVKMEQKTAVFENGNALCYLDLLINIKSAFRVESACSSMLFPTALTSEKLPTLPVPLPLLRA